MEILDFVALNYHKRVTAPGGIGGQCVDLANIYLDALFSLPPVRLDAVDWRGTKLPGFTWEVNTPLNSPPPGSLVVWQPTSVIGVGQFGHIAIALTAASMHLLTFDQDWWVEQCIPVLHDYRGVAGWHRPDKPVG